MTHAEQMESEPLLHEILRLTRISCGLTQTEVAREFGVHWNTYARWERGEIALRPAMREKIERWIEGR